MKTPNNITKLASFVALILLGGCASRVQVDSESVSDSLEIDRWATFVVEIEQHSETSLDFGPKTQAKVIETIKDGLVARGASIENEVGEAIYRIEFMTFTKEDEWAEPVMRSGTEIETTYSGYRTPAGVIITGRNDRIVNGFGTEVRFGIDIFRVFMINIYNVDGGQLIWRGRTDHGNSDVDVEIMINEIEKILDAIPFKQTGSSTESP